MVRSLIPWRERLPISFPRLENEMEDFMERYFGNGGEWGLNRYTPSLDLVEADDAYTVTAELPGLKSGDVRVELSGGCLSISGNKKEEIEEKGKTYHRVERRHGEFRRTIQLPTAVDENKVNAKFTDGVLTITIPKSKEAKTRRVEIKS